MGNSFNLTGFNDLKTVKETLSERYSSNQLMNVLDDLLENGIRVLVDNTTFLDMLMASCLSWYSGNSRRKISSLPKAKVMHLLALYPMVDRKYKLRIIRKLRLERNIRFLFMEIFITAAEEYQELEIDLLREKDILAKSLMRERMRDLRIAFGTQDNLATLGHRVKFWFGQAIEFRNQIMEKYMRHAVMKASSFYRSGSTRLDLNDVMQNFQLALSKAINKFDQRKGTLSPYVNFWLRNAQTPSGGLSHEYGIAYTIPASMKRKMAKGESTHPVNIFVPIEDDSSEAHEVQSDQLNPEQMVERDSEISRIRTLAKIADPVGLARMKLGIEEVLSSRELKLLRTAA